MSIDPNERPGEANEMGPSDWPPTGTWRIALADDDPDSLDLMRRALNGPHIAISEATNGAELVYLLGERGRFDVIVTDINMPWMEGLQVLRAARAANVNTPVLVVTGLARPDLEAKVEALDAKLLHKPFGVAELRAAVTALTRPQATFSR